MTKTDIAARVRKLICDQLIYDELPVTGDETTLDSLRADSLDRMEIGLALEDDFGLREIDQDAVANWVTVGDIVQYVIARTA